MDEREIDKIKGLIAEILQQNGKETFFIDIDKARENYHNEKERFKAWLKDTEEQPSILDDDVTRDFTCLSLSDAATHGRLSNLDDIIDTVKEFILYGEYRQQLKEKFNKVYGDTDARR